MTAARQSPVPQSAGVYLAVLQFVFALTWTVYAIYLPALGAQVGLSRQAIFMVLLLDQAIFTVMDLAMGLAADRVSRLVGRLGRVVALITGASCLAFLLLPWAAGTGPGALPLFLGLTVLWTATSSALRAPPIMLLGKYAAKPALPYLSSLTLFGLGLAGAVSPYLAQNLAGLDPRWPFAIASVTLVLVALALSGVERRLAARKPDAAKAAAAAARPAGAHGAQAIGFVLAVLVLAIGFQIHFFVNTAPLFRRVADAGALGALMPLFWVGFNIAMFPASFLAKRHGGPAVMAGAALLGALAVLGAAAATGLNMMIAAQLLAGAAWGCVMMSAFTAAFALGSSGAEGKAMGLLFSALALATFARIAAVATGFSAQLAQIALLQWLPALFWGAGGVLTVYLLAKRLLPAQTAARERAV